MVKRLVYVEIPAIDPAAAASFYAAVLGWHVEIRPGGDARFEHELSHVIGRWITGRAITSEPGMQPLFYVDDVAQAVSNVAGNGGEVIAAPSRTGDVIVARLRDPSGNAIGIWQHTDATPLPDGWHDVTARIVVDDVAGLVEFMRRGLGATGEVHPERPAVLRIGDSVVMISAAGPRKAMPAFLYVYVDDADAVYRRALDAGARSLEAPAEMPYGDRRAMVEDAWGNVWQIARFAPPR
jgi:predicted enzyme related to lactoylglutathione lyase